LILRAWTGICRIADQIFFTNVDLIKDYLRVKIDYRPKDSYLKFYQAKYIKKILKKYGFQDLKPAKTPMDPKAKLVPNKNKAKTDEIYYFQILISFLLFLALACRPDITLVVIKLARFASNPSQDYVQAIKRVFRYLKGTVILGIIYSSAN
jgi:histidyl-tRNA synthetase